MYKVKYLMLQDGLRRMFAIVFFVALARFLPAEEFGLYQQLLLVVGVFTLVFSAGVPVSISYFYGLTKSYSRHVSIYKRFFFLQICWLLIGTGLFLSLSDLLASWFDNTYIQRVNYLIVIGFWCAALVDFFKNMSVVTNQLKSFLYTTALMQILSILACIGVLLVSPSVEILMVIVSVFSFILSVILVRKNLKYFLAKLKRVYISRIELSYILAIASVSLVGVINGSIDQIMVSFMLSAKDYAELKVGSFQFPGVGIVTGSLLTVMIPQISKFYAVGDIKSVIETWMISIEKATVLIVPGIVFCLIFASDIMVTVFGEQYSGSASVFQVYMLQWLRAVVIFGGIMGAVGMEKALLRNTALVAFLNIPLNYILIDRFGILGAAISTTVLNYVGAMLLIRQINKKLNFSFFIYFPFRIYFFTLMLSLLVGIALKIVLGDYSGSLMCLILASIGFYGVILAIVMRTFYGNISISRIKALI